MATMSPSESAPAQSSVPQVEFRQPPAAEPTIVNIREFEDRARENQTPPNIGDFADLLSQATAEASSRKDGLVELLADPGVDPALIIAGAGLIVKSGHGVRIREGDKTLTIGPDGRIENDGKEIGVMRVGLSESVTQGDETPEAHLVVDQSGPVSKVAITTVGDMKDEKLEDTTFIPKRKPVIELVGNPNGAERQGVIAIIGERDSVLAGLALAVQRIRAGFMVEIGDSRSGPNLLINRPAHM